MRKIHKLNENLGYEVIGSVISYGILAFNNILYVEIIPLWAVSEKGIGLGFEAVHIGACFAGAGAFALMGQFLFYPMLSRRYKTRTMFIYGQIPVILTLAMLPIISAYVAPSSTYITSSLVFLCVLMSFRAVLYCITFTSAFILINDSAKPGQLGKVNGIAQASASLARAFGPAVGDVLWAWSIQNNLSFPLNHVAVFVILIILTIILIIQSLTMLKKK